MASRGVNKVILVGNDELVVVSVADSGEGK